MPVRKEGESYQWGDHGKKYKGKGAKKKAQKQMKAAYANGYKGDKKNDKGHIAK